MLVRGWLPIWHSASLRLLVRTASIVWTTIVFRNVCIESKHAISHRKAWKNLPPSLGRFQPNLAVRHYYIDYPLMFLHTYSKPFGDHDPERSHMSWIIVAMAPDPASMCAPCSFSQDTFAASPTLRSCITIKSSAAMLLALRTHAPLELFSVKRMLRGGMMQEQLRELVSFREVVIEVINSAQ